MEVEYGNRRFGVVFGEEVLADKVFEVGPKGLLDFSENPALRRTLGLMHEALLVLFPEYFLFRHPEGKGEFMVAVKLDFWQDRARITVGGKSFLVKDGAVSRDDQFLMPERAFGNDRPCHMFSADLRTLLTFCRGLFRRFRKDPFFFLA
jgi:hypothetical protein